MNAKNIEEPRAKLEVRIARLDARKRALQARLGRQRRATDTRRKVLLGAFLLQHLEHPTAVSASLRRWLRRDLAGFLTRPGDLALFAELLQAEEVGDGQAPGV
jgi:hypothetical protein